MTDSDLIIAKLSNELNLDTYEELYDMLSALIVQGMIAHHRTYPTAPGYCNMMFECYINIDVGTEEYATADSLVTISVASFSPLYHTIYDAIEKVTLET